MLLLHMAVALPQDCFVIELPECVSVTAGLIPLFIYARQHPTNIILLGVWVGPPRMPAPQHTLLSKVRREAKQIRAEDLQSSEREHLQMDLLLCAINAHA